MPRYYVEGRCYIVDEWEAIAELRFRWEKLNYQWRKFWYGQQDRLKFWSRRQPWYWHSWRLKYQWRIHRWVYYDTLGTILSFLGYGLLAPLLLLLMLPFLPPLIAYVIGFLILDGTGKFALRSARFLPSLDLQNEKRGFWDHLVGVAAGGDLEALGRKTWREVLIAVLWRRVLAPTGLARIILKFRT